VTHLLAPRSLAVYLKYNAALRYKGMLSIDGQASKKEWAEKEFQKWCDGNFYTSTLHAINSAVIKLGKLSKAIKVYRGLSNRSLSRELQVPNEYNVRGGIEVEPSRIEPQTRLGSAVAAEAEASRRRLSLGSLPSCRPRPRKSSRWSTRTRARTTTPRPSSRSRWA
jgi:hypothetical protein